jgi:pyrroline-5-carboxylate reductase
MNERFGLIGAGIMGEALITSLLKAGISPSAITFSEKRQERSEEISARYGIKALTVDELARTSSVILLLTKPQDLGSVLEEIASNLAPQTLIISFAAGKKISFIESTLVAELPILRIMPNTPLTVGRGISAISLGKYASNDDSDLATEILKESGDVILVPEELQDAVTAMSGSGPAYFFAFIESMVKAGVELGLDNESATRLAISTISGAAKMLEESGKTPTQLRENVTSPNGTTAAALAFFADHKFEEIIKGAIKAARDRSLELG